MSKTQRWRWIQTHCLGLFHQRESVKRIQLVGLNFLIESSSPRKKCSKWAHFEAEKVRLVFIIRKAVYVIGTGETKNILVWEPCSQEKKENSSINLNWQAWRDALELGANYAPSLHSKKKNGFLGSRITHTQRKKYEKESPPKKSRTKSRDFSWSRFQKKGDKPLLKGIECVILFEKIRLGQVRLNYVNPGIFEWVLLGFSCT